VSDPITDASATSVMRRLNAARRQGLGRRRRLAGQMGLARIPRRRARQRLARGLAAERGSLLVEVMVSAMIVLVVGFGVLAIVDRTTDLSGEQRQQAIAGNLAQTELDTVKAFPISLLSNLRRETTQTVSQVVYTITTRADWVNDSSMTVDGDVMTPNCTTPGAGFDYLNVRTTVTHPNMGARSPTILDTLISPPVRSFNANQGSLAVLVTDGATPPRPVKGLAVSLTGPATFTDDTNANGCILWGYLPAGNGYTVAFSKTGYVTPTGASAGGGSAGVVGDAPSKMTYLFDRGGSIRTNFKVKTPPSGALVDTKPKVVRVDNGGPPSFTRNYDIGATSSLDTASTGLLFPFTNAYSVYADNCVAAKPGTTDLTQPTVTVGDPVQAVDTILPALDITVTSNGVAVNNATVRVVTTCGTVYDDRRTTSAGKLADPGFPYGTGLTVCATNGTRKRVRTVTNTSFLNAGTAVAMSIGTADSGSTTGSACP
jgi:Tfp pilus assembly protein PilV